jgi:Carbohydrate-binding family 9
MLTRRLPASTTSRTHGAQIVRGPGEQDSCGTLELLQRKKDARRLPVFSLCISEQRLFCELRRSWSAGEHWKQIRNMAQNDESSKKKIAVAVRMSELPDADGFPPPSCWELSVPLRFNADWQGKNGDPERETEVRLLWTQESLFVRFHAKYRAITVFPDAAPNGRRDQLWDRDVVEVFLQPDPSEVRRYKEFEVSPNGFWIDLDIAPGEKNDLKSGLQRRVVLNEAVKAWVAELTLPIKRLVKRFEPTAIWRVNFYRVEGAAEPRFYSAWQPTRTPEPNFHVPEAFGELVFTSPRLPRK